MPLLPHTGMPWFDVVVCAVSGVAFLRVCWLFPRYVKEQFAFWRDFYGG